MKFHRASENLKKAAILWIAVTLMLVSVSCNISLIEEESTVEKRIDSNKEKKQGVIIGDYQYPEYPAENLRNALESDANNRELSMKIGSVETVELENREYSQIRVDFTADSSENVCIILFFNRHLEHGYDESLDGRDNPSFTMAFKESDNIEDMIILLTSVIKYLSPDLNLEEATRLAVRQNETISTDGYAQPSDIGGYQVQAQYTYPHVFVDTLGFEAKLGVKVRALKQIWRGTVDTGQCQELVDPQDYEYLTTRYNSWEDDKHPDIVYADFTVENVWQKQSYIHGETWVIVDIQAMNGQQYSISLDTWTFPSAYEFGIGQRYTLFIGLNYVSGYSGGIIYAVQQSESEQCNSRGKAQPTDYPTDDWERHLWRIEPEGEGAVYDVSFRLKSRGYDVSFAALEGHGVGNEQWPNDPACEDYEFIGWYDNLEWDGMPYNKDTPIYQDTNLYAKWKYTGSGGFWPRKHRGIIHGIKEDDRFSAGQSFTVTADGYNMSLVSPNDQRFRWKPITWRLSDGTWGNFSSDAVYEANLVIGDKGSKILYITYSEEIYDGINWQETGQSCEVEEVSFWVD